MIGKVTIGKSFGGCLLYCLNDKIQVQQESIMKNRAEVLMFNKCFGDQKELIQQFNEVRRLNPKLSKPVMHAVIIKATLHQIIHVAMVLLEPVMHALTPEKHFNGTIKTSSFLYVNQLA